MACHAQQQLRGHCQARLVALSLGRWQQQVVGDMPRHYRRKIQRLLGGIGIRRRVQFGCRRMPKLLDSIFLTQLAHQHAHVLRRT